MAKPESKTKRPVRATVPVSIESQAADFVTIGWMLASMTTALCVVVSLATLLLGWIWPGQTGLELLSGLMLFAGLVIGIVSVVLLVVVLRTRDTPPPRALITSCIVMALVPFLLLSLRAAGVL